MASGTVLCAILFVSWVRNTDHGNQITWTKTQICVTDQSRVLRCNVFQDSSLMINKNEVCGSSISSGPSIDPVLVRYDVECEAQKGLKKRWTSLEERNQPHGLLLSVSVFLFKQILCIRMLLHMYLLIVMVVPKSKLYF
ncbi:uncharacterized protein LOC131029149 [Cryptomeria japonica]|uniref:uncharacterized protein LOC131029149 n=1 Tax=Cryptomeria japonica TaxID=3369 RepID=UPI0025AC20DB|nr:uncharacterized protein LOC131029149 [Cryptomeria japonica]